MSLLGDESFPSRPTSQLSSSGVKWQGLTRKLDHAPLVSNASTVCPAWPVGRSCRETPRDRGIRPLLPPQPDPIERVILLRSRVGATEAIPATGGRSRFEEQLAVVPPHSDGWTRRGLPRRDWKGIVNHHGRPGIQPEGI